MFIPTRMTPQPPALRGARPRGTSSSPTSASSTSTSDFPAFEGLSKASSRTDLSPILSCEGSVGSSFGDDFAFEPVPKFEEPSWVGLTDEMFKKHQLATRARCGAQNSKQAGSKEGYALVQQDGLSQFEACRVYDKKAKSRQELVSSEGHAVPKRSPARKPDLHDIIEDDEKAVEEISADISSMNVDKAVHSVLLHQKPIMHLDDACPSMTDSSPGLSSLDDESRLISPLLLGSPAYASTAVFQQLPVGVPLSRASPVITVSSVLFGNDQATEDGSRHGLGFTMKEKAKASTAQTTPLVGVERTPASGEHDLVEDAVISSLASASSSLHVKPLVAPWNGIFNTDLLFVVPEFTISNQSVDGLGDSDVPEQELPTCSSMERRRDLLVQENEEKAPLLLGSDLFSIIRKGSPTAPSVERVRPGSGDIHSSSYRDGPSGSKDDHRGTFESSTISSPVPMESICPVKQNTPAPPALFGTGVSDDIAILGSVTKTIPTPGPSSRTQETPLVSGKPAVSSCGDYLKDQSRACLGPFESFEHLETSRNGLVVSNTPTSTATRSQGSDITSAVASEATVRRYVPRAPVFSGDVPQLSALEESDSGFILVTDPSDVRQPAFIHTVTSDSSSYITAPSRFLESSCHSLPDGCDVSPSISLSFESTHFNPTKFVEGLGLGVGLGAPSELVTLPSQLFPSEACQDLTNLSEPFPSTLSSSPAPSSTSSHPSKANSASRFRTWGAKFGKQQLSDLRQSVSSSAGPPATTPARDTSSSVSPRCRLPVIGGIPLEYIITPSPRLPRPPTPKPAEVAHPPRRPGPGMGKPDGPLSPWRRFTTTVSRLSPRPSPPPAPSTDQARTGVAGSKPLLQVAECPPIPPPSPKSKTHKFNIASTARHFKFLF